MRTIHWIQSICLFFFLTLVLAYIGARTIKPHIVTPARPPLPTKNGFDLLLAAMKQMKHTDELDDVSNLKPKHKWTLVEKHTLITENKEMFLRVNDALHYPYQEKNRLLPIDNTDATYGEFRGLARAIRFAGNVAWEEGRQRDAVEYYLDDFTIGRRMPHCVGIPGRLTGIVCESIARRYLWDHLNQMDGDTTTIVLNRLKALEAEKLPLWKTMEEEKYSCLSGALHLMRPNSFNSIMPPKYTIDMLSKQLDARIALAKRPYCEGNAKFPEREDVYSIVFVPEITETRTKYTVNEAADNLILTACALRVYCIRHGEYPADLGELVNARLLAHIPEDPFAKPGTPLTYKSLTGGKYILYSIGPDCVDDGGKGTEIIGTKNQVSRFATSESKGDMVSGWWRY